MTKDCLSTLEISYNIVFWWQRINWKEWTKERPQRYRGKCETIDRVADVREYQVVLENGRISSLEESDSRTYVSDSGGPYYSCWMSFERDRRERHPHRKTFENWHPRRSRNSERKQSYYQHLASLLLLLDWDEVPGGFQLVAEECCYWKRDDRSYKKIRSQSFIARQPWISLRSIASIDGN